MTTRIDVPAVIRFDDARATDVSLAGGKGASLARLVALDLRIPDGYVLSTAAYRATAAALAIADLPAARRGNALEEADVPAALRDQIVEAYRSLGGGKVAVRSSANAEDLDTASFAGQHDTFLDVEGEGALLDAVRRCWASLWSQRAVDYRRKRGWDEADLAMAVVVQRMVPADWAGVLFTVDPVSGNRSAMVVEAVRGLGEALVSGAASGERWRIDRSTGRLDGDRDGNVPAPVLAALRRDSLRAEEAFGGPLDIEWAVVGEQTWLLQARPLTVVASPATPRQPVHAAPSRLARSFAPTAMDHVPVTPYPFDTSLFFGPLFERILAAARSVGVGLPPTDQVLVEIADGVVQVVPPVPRPTRSLVRLPLGLARAWSADMDRWLAGAGQRVVSRAVEIDGEDAAARSDADLLGRIRELQALLLELSTTRLLPLGRGAVVSAAFGRLLRAATGTTEASLERALLADVPCTTTAANHAIDAIAADVRASDQLRDVFEATAPAELPSALSATPDGRAIVEAVDGYLRRFGLRETILPSAAFPAWRDDPALVYGLLAGLARGTGPAHADPRAAKDELVRRLERGRGPRRWLLPLLLRLLDGTRTVLAFREESHYRAFVPFPVVRRLALELGGRLAARGALDSAPDVFFLRLEELGSGNDAELRGIVERRKAARRSVGALTIVPIEVEHEGDRSLTGVPVSGGTATGPVKVVRGEAEFWKLRPGDVLVAPYTNPTWTPLFSIAAAAVVDGGGAASHAAIVAREYGLPAVMGTLHGTRRLHDSDVVLVDGSTGRVTLLTAAGG